MSIRILCLNILLLTATCYPTAIPQIILPYLARYAGKKSNVIYLCICNILYIVLCLISLLVLSETLSIKKPNSVWWYVVAIGSGGGLILLEIIVGKFVMFLRGKETRGISINNSWQNANAPIFVCTITLAIFEEINFRMMWNEVTIMQIGLPVYVFVIMSAAFYAVNHLYYGFETFLQKFVTGIILAFFYVFCGEAIIIPILVHVFQNLIILIWGRSKEGE